MNKKAKIILITILCVVLLAIVAGAIWWYAKKWEDSKEFNTPEDVTKAYIEYIDNNQFGEIYNLLTDESKQNYSKDALENAYKSFYEELNVESVKNSEIQYEKIDTFYSKATYTSTLCSIYGDIEVQNTINLKKQDDKKYYINWDYNYVYPNYSVDDVIKINKTDAKRGNISDRNGVLLAGTGYIKSVGLVPGWMNEETKTQDIQKVSELLGISVDTINKKMSASYVKEDTFVELEKISSQKLTIIDGLTQIKGVKLKDVEARVYPYGKEMAHLTGYVQRASSEDIEKNKEYDENTLVRKSRTRTCLQ